MAADKILGHDGDGFRPLGLTPRQGAVKMRMDAAGRADAQNVDVFRVAVEDVFGVLHIFRV